MSKRSLGSSCCHWAGTLIALTLSASAAAAAPVPAPPCEAKDQKVTVTAVGDGWAVIRDACPNEKLATLVFTHGTKGPTAVDGKLTDQKWSFAIQDKIAENELLRLEFHVAGTPTETLTNEAQVAFADKLRAAVKGAFDDAVKVILATKDTSSEALNKQFTLAARARIATLLKSTKADDYVTTTDSGVVPWTEAVLVRAKFHKLGEADWEPTDAVLNELKAWSAPDAQLLSTAQSNTTSPPPADCLKGKPLVELTGQNAALKACVTTLAEGAKKANDPNAELFAKLSAEEPAALANLLVRLDTTEAEGKSSAFLRKPYADALHALEMTTRTAAAKTQFDDSEPAVLYLAALEIKTALGAKAAALDAAIVPDKATLLTMSVFARENVLGEVFKVEPAKPRFFVSTGVAVTSLNSGIGDPYRLAVPIIVSICLSPNGCETKGIGAGGTPGMYMSADVGVKTLFIGSRNPRESQPSFLFGFGFTPVYAVHLGFGINAFDNPQTSNANFAPYFSVTLDTVNGKDILGDLGVATPKAQPIGDTGK